MLAACVRISPLKIARSLRKNGRPDGSEALRRTYGRKKILPASTSSERASCFDSVASACWRMQGNCVAPSGGMSTDIRKSIIRRISRFVEESWYISRQSSRLGCALEERQQKHREKQSGLAQRYSTKKEELFSENDDNTRHIAKFCVSVQQP